MKLKLLQVNNNLHTVSVDHVTAKRLDLQKGIN